MAQYDLPAMLEHVLVETGAEKVVYVGHSMGTTVFFAAMSSLPEQYQDRIAAMVALAPVATLTSVTSPIKYLAPLVNELQVSGKGGKNCSSVGESMQGCIINWLAED